MASHDIGDMRTIWARFVDDAGAQVAPTTVTCSVLKPGATTSFAATVAPAQAGDEAAAETHIGVTLTGVVGVYRTTLDLDTSGVWRYRWAGTGALAEAGEGWLTVRRRRVPAVVP